MVFIWQSLFVFVQKNMKNKKVNLIFAQGNITINENKTMQNHYKSLNNPQFKWLPKHLQHNYCRNSI